MTKPTQIANPCAFPASEACEWEPGMTLRDYFAGQALASFNNVTFVTTEVTAKMAAESAYRIADAMLKARAQ